MGSILYNAKRALELWRISLPPENMDMDVHGFNVQIVSYLFINISLIISEIEHFFITWWHINVFSCKFMYLFSCDYLFIAFPHFIWIGCIVLYSFFSLIYILWMWTLFVTLCSVADMFPIQWLFHSFFWRNNIPLHGYTTFYLSMCLLLDIWVISKFRFYE